MEKFNLLIQQENYLRQIKTNESQLKDIYKLTSYKNEQDNSALPGTNQLQSVNAKSDIMLH